MDDHDEPKPVSPGRQDDDTTHRPHDENRPTSGEQLHDITDGQDQAHSEKSLEDDDTDSDPQAKITDFDWTHLQERYHDGIQICHDEEQELMQEWESLMTFFRVWIDSGHQHETDRTFSRLQTRITYVQNEEERLEQTRVHYNNVVNAFQSALSLLKATTSRNV